MIYNLNEMKYLKKGLRECKEFFKDVAKDLD